MSGVRSAAAIIRPVPIGRVAPSLAGSLSRSAGLAGLGAVGQGVGVHRADLWQAAGITGDGIKVGIIDGGFVGLTSRIGQELPSNIHARCYREVGLFSSAAASCEAFTEHGTAVAETIADMAPDAGLYIADPISMQDLRQSVAWMTSNGVRVINVSLGFAYEGPGDGTSPPDSIYAVVDQAVAGGALWVNAAGNAGEDGWVGPWADANGNDLLDFAPGDDGNGIPLTAGDNVVVSLRWNDPWGASSNDYDVFLYGPDDPDPVAVSNDPQDGTEDPVESVGFTAATTGTYRVVVQRSSGAPVSRLQLLVLSEGESPLEHRVAAGTLVSPADSANPGMISVGAVAFDSPDVVERYSSRGPTVDGRTKPDLVAVDCSRTSVVDPFCGTSQSAPYAAGAAALVLQTDPTLGAPALAKWLRDHALGIETPVPNDDAGWGRLDLGAPPSPTQAAGLAFTQQPLGSVAGQALLIQPVVRFVDAKGVAVTAGPAATAQITISLGASAAGGTLTCTNGLTKAAVGGVAAFSRCTVSDPGTDYTIVAASTGLPSATSAPFSVLAPGTGPPQASLSIAASETAIKWGTRVTLTATLTVAGAGAALPGRAVAIQRPPPTASPGPRSPDPGRTPRAVPPWATRRSPTCAIAPPTRARRTSPPVPAQRLASSSASCSCCVPPVTASYAPFLSAGACNSRPPCDPPATTRRQVW